MARSRRRTPITGKTCCESERRDKQLWHRRFRRATKQAIHAEAEVMPDVRDVSDPWAMGKDGRSKMFRYVRDWPDWMTAHWKVLGK